MRPIDADALLEREGATRLSVGGRGCGKTLLTACRNHLNTVITTAPTIDAVPVVRWIPVTERLPEEDGSYLCFSQYCGSGWFAVRGFAKDGRKKDEYDFQRRWKNVWYDYDSEYGYCVIDSITHWMPLPEPPKEVE